MIKVILKELIPRANPFFYDPLFIKLALKKTGYSLIDFNVIFQTQSEFIKSLNFGSNLKKKTEKKT